MLITLKKWWQTIKKLIPNNRSTVSTFQTVDELTTCDKDIANEFNSHYTSVGAKLAAKFDNGLDNQNTWCTVNNDDIDVKFDFEYITPSFVFDQICTFSNKKSPGLDNFNVKLLKLAAPIICDSLAYLCNISLKNSVFPSDWKCAKVTPIFKDGDKSDVSNYRPISVLGIISEILERATV